METPDPQAVAHSRDGDWRGPDLGGTGYHALSWRAIIAACVVLFITGTAVGLPFLAGVGVLLLPTLVELRRLLGRVNRRREFRLEDPEDPLSAWSERDFAEDFVRDFIGVLPSGLLAVLFAGVIHLGLNFAQPAVMAASTLGLLLASVGVVGSVSEGLIRLRMFRIAQTHISQVEELERVASTAADVRGLEDGAVDE